MRVPLLLVAALFAVLLAGCGEGGGGGPGRTEAGPQTSTTPTKTSDRRRLTPSERSTVRRGQNELGRYCQQVQRYLSGRQGPPTPSEVRRLMVAIERVIAVAERAPNAAHRPEGTMRDVLGVLAEDLEGSNCAPNVVARLDRALAVLPDQPPGPAP